MTTFRNLAIAAGAAAMIAGSAAAPAQATHQFGHLAAGVGLGLLIGGALNANRPPIYAPAPVYVQPAPVYVQPQPVYVQPQPVYAQPSYTQHQTWCINRWRSYQVSSDTYVNNYGQTRYCDSPYNRTGLLD